MFNDVRSKSVIFVAHCILNQNSISDGTATHPAQIKEILELLSESKVGIIQMPCPELLCLGLSRGNTGENVSPIVEENTRIRKMMSQGTTTEKTKQFVQSIVHQILEYQKYGFEIKGIVGINRSPSCGVDTTSKNNKEVSGRGIFMEMLSDELNKNNININIVGIKAFEIEEAAFSIKKLLGNHLK